MVIINNPSRSEWESILTRPSFDFDSLINLTGFIIDEVKKRGDDALRELTMKYDKVDLDDITVSQVELAHAKYEISEELKKAISVAIDNITQFHDAQQPAQINCETTPGVRCWLKSLPIEKVGLYVPGGSAPLFSTVLMLAIPAKLAGCKEIIICSPPDKNGKINSAILYSADVIGIRKIYKVGGAQAIAAMAYGTQTVPKVYKIFGPGNQYVTAAKLKVSLDNVAIDMPAGPSELAVLADETCIPAYVASDMLSQAEHGEDSQVILISNSKKVIQNVIKEIDKQIELLPRKNIAGEALKSSKFILFSNETEMVEMVNEYAPEHLIIAMKNSIKISEKITNAGAVFLGNYSPESAGDYASGTNHTLPTNRNARAYSGLGLSSFMKTISFQEISKYGLFNIGPSVEKMAVTEGLIGHGRSVKIRMMDVAENYHSNLTS